MRLVYCTLFLLANYSCLIGQVVLDREFPVSDFGKSTLYKYKSNTFLWGEETNLNFRLMQETIQLKIPLENQSKEEEFILVIDNPFFDTLTLTQYSQPDLSIRTGDMFTAASKPLDYRAFAFPIRLSQGSTDTVYLEFRSRTSSFLPISIHTPETYADMLMYEYLFFGLLLGVLIIMCCYNLFIFFVLRSTSYLWYALFVGCNIFMFCSIEGIGKQLFWTTDGDLANRMVCFFIALVNPLLAQFASSFIGRKTLSNGWKIYLKAATVIGLILAILALTVPPSYTLKVTQVFSLLNSVLMLTLGIVNWKRGNRSAIYFTLAFSAYLVGAFVVIGRNTGFAPISFWTNHLIEIGSTIEVWLLSIALADRFKRIEQEKRTAQKSLLQFQEAENQRLEQMVSERTDKLRLANDEIVVQNEELQQMASEASAQRDTLELRNRQVASSLNVGQRIQRALLPSHEKLSALFPSYSLLYQPKDVVSGDFYYATQLENQLIVAVIDCTGHGVPGAFMSMVGRAALERAIHEKKLRLPHLILEEMHLLVENALNQESIKHREGMDMALVCYNFESRELTISGAKNPTYFRINAGPIQISKSDRVAIGGFRKDEHFSYSCERIALSEGDRVSVFLTTDGIQDQFGGSKRQKFGRKRLLSLLASTDCTKEVAHTVQNALTRWQDLSDEKQIDDRCLLAFEIAVD